MTGLTSIRPAANGVLVALLLLPVLVLVSLVAAQAATDDVRELRQ